jgi:choline dehydrogenase-like flavoprotein
LRWHSSSSPAGPSVNPVITVMLVAERAAELIRQAG